MIGFLFGILIGFTVGYPLGLWAVEYSEREKDGR